jgi:hypothetical protein
MHRIDGATADSNNRFTIGDPTNSIPATKVSAEWLNDVQENLSKFIEAQGITLEKGNWDQLTLAVQAALSTFNQSTTKVVILNNQSALVDLTGVIYDKTKIKSVLHEYEIHRKDNSNEFIEVGSFQVSYKTNATSWILVPMQSFNDESGVTFDVDTTSGQVKYKSTSMNTTGYEGYIRIKKTIFLL